MGLKYFLNYHFGVKKNVNVNSFVLVKVIYLKEVFIHLILSKCRKFYFCINIFNFCINVIYFLIIVYHLKSQGKKVVKIRHL